MILTPAREMRFLNVGDARERLRALVNEFASGVRPLGPDYWNVRDRYYAGVWPSQNYNLRRVLARESFGPEVVSALLRDALASETDLADLGDADVDATVEKCQAVKDIIPDDSISQAEQAQRLAKVVTPKTPMPWRRIWAARQSPVRPT